MLSCVLCVPWCHHGTATLCVQDAPCSAVSLGVTIEQSHQVSGVLQAQLCPSVAPWHNPTACPGCSRLSCVPCCHHGTVPPHVQDAPDSVVSLSGTVAQPHCVSRILQAQLSPLGSPWHGHTVCPGCSRLNCVPCCHHGMVPPSVQDAPDSVVSLSVTMAQSHRVSRMLQAQLCPLLSPWHSPTECLGCSKLSCVPLWHRGTPAPSISCLLYTSPSPRDRQKSRMPSSA